LTLLIGRPERHPACKTLFPKVHGPELVSTVKMCSRMLQSASFPMKQVEKFLERGTEEVDTSRTHPRASIFVALKVGLSERARFAAQSN